MNTLFILNGAPYGAEPTYNGLRLAGALARLEGQTVRLFLMGDAASGAKAGQKVPEGYYNVLHMLGRIARAGGEVAACGTCLDARGIAAEELGEGIHRGTLDELAGWTAWADKVLVF
ncbi:MAG: DsrE family protein [Rhodocyclaceae bacterium]|nr:DsrE family protein [Rhodocyclaceae bacterium]